MTVSVTVEQKIMNGEAGEKRYIVEVEIDANSVKETNKFYSQRKVFRFIDLSAPEAQELAEKLQAEVSKALSI